MQAVEFRHSFGACYYNGSIIVCGGYSDNSEAPVKLCERYEISKNVWTEMGALKHAVAGPGLVKFNEMLLKFGGIAANKVINTIERYDFKNN